MPRRHAEYHRDLFERAEAEWETRPSSEWMADYAWRIDDLRAALDWALSPRGDAAIGVAATAAAVPLWIHLSLIQECQSRVEHALVALGEMAEPDLPREMKLRASLGRSLAYTKGDVPDLADTWGRALQLATSLGDVDYQLRGLQGLWSFHLNNGRHDIALALAQRFSAVAARSSDLSDLLVGERMMGLANHFRGDQVKARGSFERVLANYVPPPHKSHIIRFQNDQRVAARAIVARILWLQGFPDQAIRASEQALRMPGLPTTLYR